MTLDALLRQARVGVYLHDLQDGRLFVYNEHEVFHAASTMKLAVLLAARGLRHDAWLPLTTRFDSLVPGETFELDPRDDSDPDLYARVGGLATVAELRERMITRSSNLATNVLLERVGAADVTATLRALGVQTMTVLRGVEDGPAFRKGLVNTTTAADLARVLLALNDDEVQLLLRQEHRDGIPAGTALRVANKTGVLHDHAHDAALIVRDGKPPCVLVVLTQGGPGFALIAQLTRALDVH